MSEHETASRLEAALCEIEALRRQVAEFAENGVSIARAADRAAKAAADRAAKAERAAIVAWLRAQPVGMGTIWSASYAIYIERGDHEEGR